MDEYIDQAIKRLRIKFGLEEEVEGDRGDGSGAREELERRHRINHARYVSNPVYRGRVDAAYPSYSRAVRKADQGRGGKTEKTK